MFDGTDGKAVLPAHAASLKAPRHVVWAAPSMLGVEDFNRRYPFPGSPRKRAYAAVDEFIQKVAPLKAAVRGR